MVEKTKEIKIGDKIKTIQDEYNDLGFIIPADSNGKIVDMYCGCYLIEFNEEHDACYNYSSYVDYQSDGKRLYFLNAEYFEVIE